MLKIKDNVDLKELEKYGFVNDEIYELQQENKQLKDNWNKLKENYERIYNENCILRQKHNITDISLLDENYELKQKYENAVEDYETTMFEKVKLERQQKEFINYLENEIKLINPKELDIGELNLRLDDIKFTQYLTYKEILQKYKSIIGVLDDKK